MSTERQVVIYDSKKELVGGLADRFIDAVVGLQAEQPIARVVLTGGSVGIGVLAAVNESSKRDSIDWVRLDFWWGDERWLPRGHEERNDRQAMDALLNHVEVPAERVHPFPHAGEAHDLESAAKAYAEELTVAAETGALLPKFDITFLGVGPDAHVASLFPRQGVSAEPGASVIAVRDSPKPPSERLSLSLSAINSSEQVWLALAGNDKAQALAQALADTNPEVAPVAGVRAQQQTVFFVDRDAAELVRGTRNQA